MTLQVDIYLSRVLTVAFICLCIGFIAGFMLEAKKSDDAIRALVITSQNEDAKLIIRRDSIRQYDRNHNRKVKK